MGGSFCTIMEDSELFEGGAALGPRLLPRSAASPACKAPVYQTENIFRLTTFKKRNETKKMKAVLTINMNILRVLVYLRWNVF